MTLHWSWDRYQGTSWYRLYQHSLQEINISLNERINKLLQCTSELFHCYGSVYRCGIRLQVHNASLIDLSVVSCRSINKTVKTVLAIIKYSIWCIFIVIHKQWNYSINNEPGKVVFTMKLIHFVLIRTLLLWIYCTNLQPERRWFVFCFLVWGSHKKALLLADRPLVHAWPTLWGLWTWCVDITHSACNELLIVGVNYF